MQRQPLIELRWGQKLTAITRNDYQLPAGQSPEDALAPAALKTRIDATLAMLCHAGPCHRALGAER